ncbi:MAG: hypothetical protein LPD71_12275, partial [Shewanella sp.]|nr:hypothetical protein [Shewanella sp.]
MKNIIRYFTGVVSLAAVFTLPVLSAEPGCNGNWQVMLHSDSAVEASRQANGVWIPATISLDRQLAACGKGITFRQAAGGPLQLTAGVSSQAYELANGSRQKLKNNGKDQYWMPLYGKQQVDFWLYLPRGQHMLPGLYQSIVDMQLMAANNAKPLQKVHTFSYLVKPYVRARLNKNGDNWLPSSGTSVLLDLGDLTRANSVELPVYLESNGFVTMSVKSEHKGNLMLMNDAQQQ